MSIFKRGGYYETRNEPAVDHDPTEAPCADLDERLNRAAQRLRDGHIELAHEALKECIAHKALSFTGGDGGPNRIEHRLNMLINMARLSTKMKVL